MLVLKRKVNEVVEIYNPIDASIIEVHIAHNNGSTVSLGFKAPSYVKVDRKEIAESKRQEGEYASRRPRPE